MELMLANEARDKACRAELDIVARDTEEIMDAVIRDIEKDVSNGKISTLVYMKRYYHSEAIERVRHLLREKGYFSREIDALHLEVSWDVKNPYKGEDK